MRQILNFMLRLFIDEEAPAQLHGAIKPAGDGDSFAFRTDEELIEFLHRVSKSARLRNGQRFPIGDNQESKL
ncbi:MAG TPA: hypothetical protein PKW33_10515 [Anaerolineaceae bacterium]|nr:hypothetical protein [Anaerolineaceae bacterium]HPN52010.1 hypothetical protein [Anaerolineaceae bacterium]